MPEHTTSDTPTAERTTIVYPAMIWLVAFGGYLLGRTDPAPAS